MASITTRVTPRLDQPIRQLAATTGSSSNGWSPPAPARLRPPGTRTQHTISALPISRAATRSMICSSIVGFCQHRVSSLAGTATYGGRQVGIAREQQNLILVLNGNSEGPMARSPAPG